MSTDLQDTSTTTHLPLLELRVYPSYSTLKKEDGPLYPMEISIRGTESHMSMTLDLQESIVCSPLSRLLEAMSFMDILTRLESFIKVIREAKDTSA